MSLFSFSSPLKRLYKFVLKRALGSFLQYELDLDQLDVQLAKGEVVLRDLELNVQLLNDLCVDLPLTFIRARIGLVHATIPWRNLLSKSCILKLDQWELVVVPSEQVQHRSSGLLSSLAASVLEVDPQDLELQKSLSSLGAQLRQRERRASGSGVTTPMSMSGSGMAMGMSPARTKEAMDAEAERVHERLTAAAVREGERKRKLVEKRRQRREEVGESDIESDTEGGVQVESEAESDEESAEAASSVHQQSARHAAAFDTANEGLKVVASFLEQVVSAIELEVSNVTIRIQHQPRTGHATTNLIIHLPFLNFTDLNKQQEEQQQQQQEDDTQLQQQIREEVDRRRAEAAERRRQLFEQRREERERRRAERAARAAAAANEGGGAAADIMSSEDAVADAAEEEADRALFMDAEAEEEDEAEIRREMELKMARDQQRAAGRGVNLANGPRYEYFKAIRFHGFRVDLHEDSSLDGSAQFQSAIAQHNHPDAPPSFGRSNSVSEPQTIISGSMDQSCMIQLKLKLKEESSGEEPRLESTCFIHSLRALLTPRQLALLTDLGAAIGLSAQQVASNAQAAQQLSPRQQQLPHHQQAAQPVSTPSESHVPQFSSMDPSSYSSVPLDGSIGLAQPLDYNAIDGLLSHASHSHPHSSPHSSDERFFDLAEGSGHEAATHAGDRSEVVNLWSMETHILHCSLTLTENDQRTWPTEWYKTEPDDQSQAHAENPHQLVTSAIPSIFSNHLFLSAQHTFINVHQSSAESRVDVTLGHVQAQEYLMQHWVDEDTMMPDTDTLLHARPRNHPTRPTSSHVFRARPVISFETASSSTPVELEAQHAAFMKSTRSLSAPHVKFEYRNTVDANSSLSFSEPLNFLFEPHPRSCINSRLTLTCQPATLDVDLGIGDRLNNLNLAITNPLTYLHGNASGPPSGAVSMNNSGSLPHQRQQQSQMSAANPAVMNGEELLHQLASAQRRHSLGADPIRQDNTSYAQIVIMAPSIDLNVLFPATTPSQTQPHPYTKMADMIRDPYRDARGILRPEHVSMELHDVSVCSENEISNGSGDMQDSMLSPELLRDSEWIVRFLKASVFMHYPKQEKPQQSQSADSVEDEDDDEDLDENEKEMVSKRIITTTYPSMNPASAAAAYRSRLATLSYISILLRAPIILAPEFQPAISERDPSAASVDPAAAETAAQQRMESMFFDSLPHVRYWEESGGDPRQRTFKSCPTTSSSTGPMVTSSTSSSSLPDAALFESLAIKNSSMLVTIHLPVAALHMAKYDYDLLLFLYNIYVEVMEPKPVKERKVDEIEHDDAPHAIDEDSGAMDSARAFAQSGMAASMYHSALSAAEEEDQVDVNGLNGLNRSQHYRGNASSGPFHHALSGGDDELNDENDDDGAGSLHSDSFSSDSSSEMFESVAGADSVILGQNGMGEHGFGHRSRIARHGLSASAHTGPSSGSILALRSAQADNMMKSGSLLRRRHVHDTPSSHNESSRRLTVDDTHEEEGDADADGEQEEDDKHVASSSPIASPQLPSLSAEDGDGGGDRQMSDSSLGSDSLTDSSQQLDDDNDDDAANGSGGRHIAFGTQSIVLGQARSSRPPSSLSNADNNDGDGDGMDQSDALASTSESSSQEINPTDIFVRASATSGRSQLFQPAALSLSSVLPPVSEVLQSSGGSASQAIDSHSAANSQLMRSSMMESRDDGQSALFHSFLPLPAEGPLPDPNASVDYSHLPRDNAQQLVRPHQPRHLNASTSSSPPHVQVHPRHVPPPSTHRSPPRHTQPSSSSSPPHQPPPAYIPSLPPNSPYKHFLSLRLSIQRASLVLQDDPPSSASASANATSSSSSSATSAPSCTQQPSGPQTFHADIGEVRLFQVSEFNGKPVQYIAIRAGDLTLREYRDVVTDERQLYHTPSMPILFKTIGDEPHGASASPPVDAWGKPLNADDEDDERKDRDDDGGMDEHGQFVEAKLNRSTDDPLTSVSGLSPPAPSVAWSNPVLLINVVVKLNPELRLRDTQAVINLRALTLHYCPASQWIQKMMEFFTPTAYEQPPMPPAFNIAAPPPPPPLPVTNDLLHLFLHAYDCSVDYSPPDLVPRAIISVDHVHLHTTVYPDSSVSVMKLEVRDMAVYVLPKAAKADFAPTMHLSELPAPFLHRLPHASIFAYAESVGFARVATMDFLDAVITQNMATSSSTAATASQRPSQRSSETDVPALSVEMSNGLLSVFTCWDSFQVLMAVSQHLVAAIQEVSMTAEVDVRFDGEVAEQGLSAQRNSNIPTYHVGESSATKTKAHAGPATPINPSYMSPDPHNYHAAYLLDDDETLNGEEQKSQGKGVRERNILDDIDHNAFGADLGVAHVYHSGGLQMKLNERHVDEQHRQTAISLALQAAAEQKLNEQRAHSQSPPIRSPPAASSSSGPSSEQSAQWYSARESQEMVEQERIEKYIASLTDEDARERELELQQEREERRRRRREEERRNGTREPIVAPTLIDNHIPLADDDILTGRYRFKPPPDYPRSITITQLLNLAVCWRMFGGQDWDMSKAHEEAVAAATAAAAAASAAHAQARSLSSSVDAGHLTSSTHASNDDEYPHVYTGGMGSVDIQDFYEEAEPFRPLPNPFAAPMHDPSASTSHTRVGSTSNATSHRSPPSISDSVPRGERQTDRVLEVSVRGANVRYDQFPSGVQHASRVVIALDEIEVHDLISSSPFNSLLCYYAAPGRGRELGSSMIRLDMTSVRPDPSREREEYRIKLSVLPLRLHVDQEAVNFLIEFFSHTPLGEAEAAARAVEEEVRAAALAGGGAGESLESSAPVARFHDVFRQSDVSLLPSSHYPILAGLKRWLQPHHSQPIEIVDPHQARTIAIWLYEHGGVQNQQLAKAVGFSDSMMTAWRSGQSGSENVSTAMMNLLNRLMPLALEALRGGAPSNEADDDSDVSDDELASGMGRVSFASPTEPSTRPRAASASAISSSSSSGSGARGMESIGGPVFDFPPMSSDWIPSDIRRHYSHLVPALTEAYNKYYDIIHASMPDTVSTVRPWRPALGIMALQPGESLNDYRSRILAAARTAARTQLFSMGAGQVREVESQLYIQSFQVVSKIVLCIDWNPHTFDLQGLQGGDYGQLANLIPLENMEVELKSVKMTGIPGFDRVGMELAKLWAYDVSRHQAHKYIAAVQPIRSIVNVGSGVADLVLLPMQHYKKHGNLKRGVQRGLSSFLRNVSLESMSAAARLAQGTQSLLESVEDVLTYHPAPLPHHAQTQYEQQRGRARGHARSTDLSSMHFSESRRRPSHISKQAGAPSSAQEGFRQAYDSLSRGLHYAAQQLVVVPREQFQRHGSKGAVRSALQGMPAAVLSPVIGGMEAVAKVLNGAVHSLDPKRKKENMQKFKTPNSNNR